MVILSFYAFFPIPKEISQNIKKDKKKHSRDGVKRRRKKTPRIIGVPRKKKENHDFPFIDIPK